MKRADEAWRAYVYDDGPDDDDRAAAISDEENEAETELFNALAALSELEADK